MGVVIASGIVAFFVWCVTPTNLKPEDVRNSKGELTFWSLFAVVLVQLVLWTLVFFVYRIIPYLPEFFTTGWRLGLTLFVAAFCQFFATLMILQYVWTIIKATGKTGLVATMAALGSQSARRSLDDAPWRSMEKNGSASAKPTKSSGRGSSTKE